MVLGIQFFQRGLDEERVYFIADSKAIFFQSTTAFYLTLTYSVLQHLTNSRPLVLKSFGLFDEAESETIQPNIKGWEGKSKLRKSLIRILSGLVQEV